MKSFPLAPSRAWHPGRCLTLLSALLSLALLPPRDLQAAPPSKVALFSPTDGTAFLNPDDIPVLVQVEDEDGFTGSVEVFTDLGSLGKVSYQAAAGGPGEPLHWTWRNPPSGDHKLVAQAMDSDGSIVFSESLAISVRRDSDNGMATLRFTEPARRSAVPLSTPVRLVVVAVDPAGDIRHVEFFANGQAIGTSDHLTKEAVIPGRPIEHTLEWTPTGAGQDQVIARAIDTRGSGVESSPIEVFVGLSLPVVSIEATVPETSEPGPTVRIRPGLFTLSRTGELNRELTVYLVYDGSALPGVDYEALPKSVTFAAGQGSAELLVQPLEDTLLEGIETVSAMLVDPGFDRLPDHLIDASAGAAKILIHDQTIASPARIRITTPVDGQAFPPDSTITISALALDPNGYIAKVAFFDGEEQIGVSEITFIRAPDPGTPIQHTLEWQHPPMGKHYLTVRSLDSNGQRVVSEGVTIVVGAVDQLPVVAVTALDAEAIEFPLFVDAVDSARFQISRDGDLTRDLLVVYTLHGTAQPEADYPRPPRYLTIPAGQSEATIEIVPTADEVAERMETIAIRLEDPMPISSLPVPPSPYDRPIASRQAAAVIYDQAPPAQPALELALPSAGEVYRDSEPIALMAAAYHPGMNISHVEFFAGEKLIGVSDIQFLGGFAPGSGLVMHSILWPEPWAGHHVITARAKLPDGTELVSSEIPIEVTASQPAVVSLDLTPLDSDAAEVGADGAPDPAVFSIRRSAGPKDVDVEVFYDVSGSAQNGVDYAELTGSIKLPAGQESVELVINPIPDGATEGEEVVVIQLRPPICPAIFPPPPWCYQIRGGGAAKAVIRDQELPMPPDPAGLELLRPQNGSVYSPGETIEIVVQAKPLENQPGKLQILVDGNVLASGPPPQLSAKWEAVSAGTHVMTGRTIDAGGNEILSQSAKLLVLGTEVTGFVRRELPPTYNPGEKLKVELTFDPALGNSPYALEDQPPAGWIVSDISDGGVFDPATGKVKFGLIAGDAPYAVSYMVTPPPDANGYQKFLGATSAGGSLAEVSGNRTIASATDASRPPKAEENVSFRRVGLQDGHVQLELAGPAGNQYVLEVSTDLVNWVQLAPVFLPDGQIAFKDETNQAAQKRFYRTRLP
ncbi:MAG: Ig-like domain-containing protein [Verrucomicrobiota bacterium]